MKKLRTVICEDNAADAELMARQARRDGFELDWRRVETEPDFVAALHPAPDLILADYSMPRFSGLRALDLLRESGLDIPFILVSGTLGEEAAVEAMKRGATDYLMKDHVTRLGHAVERALAEKRLRQRSAVFSRLGERLSAAADGPTAARIISEAADGLVGWDACTFDLYYEKENAVVPLLNIDVVNGRRVDVPPAYAGPALSPRIARTIARGAQLILRQPGEGFSTDAVPFGDKARPSASLLFVPVREGARAIGVMSIQSYRPNAYTAQDLETLQALADHCGGALERIHVTEALRQAEAKYRSIFENAVEGLYQSTPAGRFVTVNPAMARIFGYASPEEMMHGVTDIARQIYVEPEQREEWQHQLQERGHVTNFEHEARRRDGTRIWVCQNARRVTDAAGRTLYYEGSVEDITERRRAEEALRENERRFRATFEQAAVGMAHVLPEGRFKRVNQKFCDITGYTRSELLERTFQDITHPDDLKVDTRFAERLLAGELSTYSMEKRYLRRDGSVVWIALTVSLVRGAGGAPDYFIAVVADISDRRSLEEQLRQSQKMEAIGQLAGGVAHDFNNILAVMMIQTELAERVNGVPEEVQDALRELRAAAQRAAHLTRQLLLFGRRQVMQPRVLDVNEIVTSLAKMLQRVLGETVRLRLQLSDAPVVTRADPGMLEQVLMNLAINARDAMPDGGHLRIETAHRTVGENEPRPHPEAVPGRYAVLAVGDTGCGIPREILPRIFEPFFTTKEPGKGTGLGLATVFSIVQQHRGWLDVRSAPGQGTRFEIFLPASAATVTVAGLTPATSSWRRGTETILVVEDDSAVRLLTRAILERHGYHVLEACDGIDAQRLWQRHRGEIALLLTDLVMPEGGGRELARRLQTDRPDLKVIFTSGYSPDLAGQELHLNVGENFLPKPASPQQLLDLIRRSLDA